MYARAIGLRMVMVLFAINMVHETTEMYLDVWLSKWSNDHVTPDNVTNYRTQRNIRMGVYAALGLFRGN